MKMKSHTDLDSGPDIEGSDNGSHALGLADGSQTGNASANNEDLCAE